MSIRIFCLFFLCILSDDFEEKQQWNKRNKAVYKKVEFKTIFFFNN